MRTSRSRLVLAAASLSVAVTAATVVPSSGGVVGASDDAPTCHGRRATIVGAPGEALTGTEGPDVIVTAGSTSVDARGGDDTICATQSPDTSLLLIHAGSGRDVVDRRADALSGSPFTLITAEVSLGPGVDSFVGNADPESVFAGGGDTVVGGGGEASAGGDRVELGRSRADGPATATIRLSGTAGSDTGLGNEVLIRSAPARGLSIDGGGSGSLDVTLPTGAWELDAGRGELSREGRLLGRVTGFKYLHVDAGGTAFDFVGGVGPDHLGVSGSAPVTASLGGGRDALFVGLQRCAAQQVRRADGGPGHDTISIVAARCGNGAPVVDLRAGALHSVRGGRRSPLTSFEDAFLSGDDDGVLVGDGGPNDLQIEGCGGTVRGGAGDDRISVHPALGDYFDPDGYQDCPGHPVARLSGQLGDDHLTTGGDLTGRMYGGAGRDVGTGASEERDVCDTELRRLCHPPATGRRPARRTQA